MPLKLFGTNLIRPRKPTQPLKATPLQLPPEIVSQIVAYVLRSEDDWITLYRTTPRWRQPKFEAGIEWYIIRQRRLESVRLASVSKTFLIEVLFNLKQIIREQNIVIAGMQEGLQDYSMIRFLVWEREMLCDVSQQFTSIRDGEPPEFRGQRTWKNKLSDAVKRMTGTVEYDKRPTNTCLCRLNTADSH